MTDSDMRMVRAAYTVETITVYQAYSPQSADAAWLLPAEQTYPLSPAPARQVGAEPGYPAAAQPAEGAR